MSVNHIPTQVDGPNGRASDALPALRRRTIVAHIQQHGGASTSELMRLTGVSISTITRDLGELQRQGLIVRVHGGALHHSLMSTGWP